MKQRYAVNLAQAVRYSPSRLKRASELAVSDAHHIILQKLFLMLDVRQQGRVTAKMSNEPQGCAWRARCAKTALHVEQGSVQVARRTIIDTRC
jgi:hypothetical protein